MTQPTNTELLNYLDSESNEYGLDSISAHGFLTATLVGKPLDNWLSSFFDGQDGEIAESIKADLRAWQDDIFTQLKNEQPIELAFMQADDDAIDLSEDSDLALWCVGFIDAMYAENAADWFDDADTEDDVAMLTLPMLAFSGIDADDENLQDLRSDEEILIQMANKIEGNLTELFLLFHTND